MNAKIIMSAALAIILVLTPRSGFGQGNIELGAYGGGQINGGVDLTTTLFHRIDVGNSVNYGLTLGYLLGEHYGVEFQWNHSDAGTRAQPIGGVSSIKVFNLTQNQYMGNFLVHLTPRETMLRPYIFFGLGANALAPDRGGVQGSTRFAFALGAGAKYSISRHIGLRGQLRYSPTYLTTTSTGGYWCDPFWGGCWVEGHSHYLNSFDATGGITLRF